MTSGLDNDLARARDNTPFIRRTRLRMQLSKQYRDMAEDERTTAPALLAASGIWLIVLAGFVTTAFEYPVQSQPPGVQVVVNTDSEQLELAVLREVSEVEPQQQLR
jgi:hypothetical protein